MKSICLIQPPQPSSLDDMLNPSLSLLSIASYVRRFGYPVSYCELAGTKGNTESDFYKAFSLRIPQADVFGITFYTPSYKYVKIIVQVIKDKYPSAKIVVGGAHPSALPEDALSIEGIDAVIRYEGEECFLRWLDSGCPKGIFKSETSLIEKGNFPHPARDLIDYTKYTKTIEGIKSVDIMTSRGCPWKCSFCYKCSADDKVRFNTIEWVKDDIIKAREISSSIVFQDDVFTLNRNFRLYPLLDYMQYLNITWRCHAKPGYNNLEDFKRMKQAGCKCVAVGVETGSEKLLKGMNKGVTVEQNAKTIRDLHETDLLSKAYFISMFPGENEETVDETLSFVDTYSPDQFSIFTCTILPGTDMYNNPEKYGITWISKDWLDYQFVSGDQSLGGCNFETKWMKREKMIELNKKFVEEMMKKKQKGIMPNFYKDLKWRKL